MAEENGNPATTTMTGGEGGGGEGGGGEGGGGAWYEGLGLNEAQTAVIEKNGFKSGADVVTAYDKLSTRVGSSLPAVKDGDVKNWDGWKELGVPEKPDGYELANPEGLPEGFEIDNARLEAFRAVAHENNVPPHAVAALYDWYVKDSAGSFASGMASVKEQTEAYKAALEQEWPGETDGALDIARRGFAWLGFDSEALKDLESVVGGVALTKALHKLGKELGEDGGGMTGGGDMTADEASEQLAALKDDKEFQAAFRTAGHRDHDAAVERYNKLSLLAKAKNAN